MTAAQLTALLTDPALFSRHILRQPLYDYQIKPLTAVLNSILNQHGDEFLIVMPRQSGKDESLAHLLTLLLNLFQRTGGNIVYGDIGDGIGRFIQRLEERLDNDLNKNTWKKGAKPNRRILGRAACVFKSTHTSAHARGETAHHLLIINEAQDQDAPHIEAVFTPMRAARNATAVYAGTVKLTTDFLWQKKKELERISQQDGLQRVFFVYPEQVTAENPAYGRFLAAQIARHGEKHPIIQSEYYLKPVDGAGGLFPPRRIALMKGTHGRLRQPEPGKIYIAVIDVGGQDEAATDPIARLANPGRDYTACTIFEMLPAQAGQPGPTFLSRDIFIDQGSRHFEEFPGRPSLATRLLAFLTHWQVAHTVIDQSGVGEGLTSWLQAAMGKSHVTGFKFSPLSKAQLGNLFLSLIETGRFKYWQSEADYGAAWWFFTQAAACGYEVPANGRFERDLRWSVPASHKTPTPAGPQPTHDDRLISAALIAQADELLRCGTIAIGTAESAIIAPRDPLKDLSF